jgi:hypothetical protein
MDRTGPNWKNKQLISEPSFNWVINMVLKRCGMILLRGTVVHTSPCSWHVFFQYQTTISHIIDIYWHVGSVKGAWWFPFLMPDLDLPGIGFGVPLFKQGDAKDFPISMGG